MMEQKEIKKLENVFEMYENEFDHKTNKRVFEWHAKVVNEICIQKIFDFEKYGFKNQKIIDNIAIAMHNPSHGQVFGYGKNGTSTTNGKRVLIKKFFPYILIPFLSQNDKIDEYAVILNAIVPNRDKIVFNINNKYRTHLNVLINAFYAKLSWDYDNGYKKFDRNKFKNIISNIIIDIAKDKSSIIFIDTDDIYFNTDDISYENDVADFSRIMLKYGLEYSMEDIKDVVFERTKKYSYTKLQTGEKIERGYKLK